MTEMFLNVSPFFPFGSCFKKRCCLIHLRSVETSAKRRTCREVSSSSGSRDVEYRCTRFYAHAPWMRLKERHVGCSTILYDMIWCIRFSLICSRYIIHVYTVKAYVCVVVLLWFYKIVPRESSINTENCRGSIWTTSRYPFLIHINCFPKELPLISSLLAYPDAGPTRPQENVATRYDRYVIATYTTWKVKVATWVACRREWDQWSSFRNYIDCESQTFQQLWNFGIWVSLPFDTPSPFTCCRIMTSLTVTPFVYIAGEHAALCSCESCNEPAWHGPYNCRWQISCSKWYVSPLETTWLSIKLLSQSSVINSTKVDVHSFWDK